MSEAQKTDAHYLEVAELEIERLPLSDVSPHSMNPRQHSPEQIKAIEQSLLMDGYIAGSMGIQRSTRTLYKGHGVYHALLNLGTYEADFVVKDLTDAETLALLARDNALSDMSTNDPVKLKAISVNLQAMNVPIRRMGYTLKEITSMQPKREVVEDDPPEVSEEVVSKTGDLWRLGKHRVLCGDSTKKSDVERVMGGEKANNAFTSPPYAEQRSAQYGGIPVDKYVDWWEKIQENVKTAFGGNGSFFVNIKEHCEDGERSLYVKDLVLEMKRRFGWRFIDELCWYKRIGPPGHWDYRFKNVWEPVFHFSIGEIVPINHDAVDHDLKPASIERAKGKASGTMGTGSPFVHTQGIMDATRGLATNVIETPPAVAESVGKSHPAMFPTRLPAFFIKAFSDEGDPWFDPFLGSGTTLIAADQLDRICYGIEIAPKYVDVIVKRYINHVGSDEHVTVERNGKTLTWEQANKKLPKVV